MSSRAIGLSEAPKGLRALRFLDLAVLALVLPLFLVAELPLVGYAVAAGAWVVQRAIRELLERRAEASDDVRVAVGVTAASMIARGWLAAFAIFGAYLVDGRQAGLAAAVLFLFLFTLAFSVQAMLRPFERPSPAPKESP